MNIVAIYPGRFQPFGLHHFKTFEFLQNQFGKQNCYIVTSDKTDNEKSPLNFKEKLQFITKQNVNSSRVVKVKSPYKSEELMSKFDENNTIAIFMYGTKDAQRISTTKKDGTPGYFQKFKSIKECKPFSEHGYIIEAPHVSIKLPNGKEMSGTNIREFIYTCTKKEFKDAFGWFDEKLYNFAKEKFSSITKENIKMNIDKVLMERFVSKYILKESPKKRKIIKEGGVAGHLSHLMDDLEMTFGDLKKIGTLALSGKLNLKTNVTEKTDGMNLHITYKNNDIGVARNKSEIKNPMNIDSLKTKFDGRGEVYDAFVFSMQDLKKALLQLGEKTLNTMFEDGKYYINLEVIYPSNSMTLSYGDTAYIQFHTFVKADENGNVTHTSEKQISKITDLINKVNANIQEKFTIIGPQDIKLNQVQDYKTKIEAYNSGVKKIQGLYGLNDNNTIKDYYTRFWKKYCKENFGLDDDNILEGLINRWIGINKSFRLNKQMIPDPDMLSKITEFEKTKMSKIQRKNVETIEDLVLKMSADVLMNATNFLNSDNPTALAKIKTNLMNTIKQIRASGDLNDIEKLYRNIERLQKAGGLKTMIPSEGVVFMYNGKTYKLTGTFAPLNQIMGIIKFK